MSRPWMSFLRVSGIAVTTMITGTCGGSKECPTCPPPPVLPARATLVITTPNADDGAWVLRINGIVDSVTTTGATIRTAVRQGQTTILVIGDLSSGPIAEVWAPHGFDLTSLSVSIIDAAARSIYTKRDVAEYTGSLTD